MKEDPGKVPDKHAERGPCSCPFCDAELEKVYPFCKDCGKEIRVCSKCGRPVPPHVEICSDCRK